jgi:hypothetical protein
MLQGVTFPAYLSLRKTAELQEKKLKTLTTTALSQKPIPPLRI